MKKTLFILGIGFLGIAIVAMMIGGWVMGSYNGMVTQNEVVNAKWAEVETQYQRRFDLVPNLVNTVKGAMKQEQAVFGAIAEARTHYANAKPNSDEKVQATNQYEGALARLLVVMENYPQLKSLENVQALTDEIAGTENRIAVSRGRYNEEVNVFNISIKQFPRSFLANMFGFKERTFFQSKEEASLAPVVNFDTI